MATQEKCKFGTGVNTGTCIVGNMGAETRLDYSVVGDVVNLGATRSTNS